MNRKQSRLERAIRPAIEQLESRLLMASTPHTADGQPWLIGATGVSWVEAEDFDNGGEGVAYHDSSAANQGGKYRTSEAVDIEGPSASTGGTYNIGYVTAGEWLNYTINVAQAGSYQLNLRASNANAASATAHVLFGGNLNTGPISIVNTGGWGNYQNFTVTVNLSAGTQVMQLTDDSGGFNIDYLSLQNTADLANPEQAYGSRGLPPLVAAGGQARVEAENYDTGGEGLGYHRSATTKSSTATLNGQPFRPNDMVSTSNSGTGIATTYWKPGDWTQYIVDAAQAGQFELMINYARGDANNSNFSIAVNGTTQVNGLALPSNSSWTSYTTVATVVNLSAGQNILRFTTAVGQINFDYFQLIQSTTFGNNGASWNIPASGPAHIEAENFNIGTAGSSDATPTNTGDSSYRPGSAVDLSATTDSSGSVDVVDFTSGESLNYTIRPQLVGNYDLRLRILAPAGGQLKVQFDSGAGFDASANADLLTYTANIPAAAGWQTITLPVRFQSGLQTMRISAFSGGVNLNWFELQKNTTTAVLTPGGSGTYAAEPPDAALNSTDNLFDRVYVKQYDWINRPAGAAIPTNDWWTQILEAQFAANMWAYPADIQDAAGGVTIQSVNNLNITAGNVGTGSKNSITVGGTNDTFTRDALLDYGDWTVHYRMQEAGSNYMDVTMGRGLPYTWFEFNGMTPQLTVPGTFTAYNLAGTALGSSFTTDAFRIANGGRQFAVFAPAGTTFTLASGKYTVSFAGAEKYLVAAVLPDPAAFQLFYDHAYAIPRNSRFDYAYDAVAGTVNTMWTLDTVALRAGASTDTIQGWLPQDYEDMKSGPTLVGGYSYPTIQGAVKIAVGKQFTLSQSTAGINFSLPVPQSIGGTSDYSSSQMLYYIQRFITQHTNTAASQAAGKTILNYGADTYWGGKSHQEIAEFALMAKAIGATAEYNVLLDNLRSIMTDWLTYTPGESAHYFAWYPDSKALIGFQTSYGAESFTDNMFHYGYFTASAGVLAMLDPTWAAQYGEMAKMIAMEYANWSRPDNSSNANSLPYFRTFEPWVGHSYAGGTGDARGNNEESTSESIQSWLGLVLLGQALNDSQLTAAGMMGYARESKAVQYQWFDVKGETFQSPASTAYARSNVAINYDDSKGYGTFFGANPEYILGIESLPLWPSLDFLGQYPNAARNATQSMLAQRAVYYNDPTMNTWASFDTGGVNDWLNINLGFQAMYDPQATADVYAQLISQGTPTAKEGTTGLYYYQTHAYRTYGLRDFTSHLSLPIGGVYVHGNDGTSMTNTKTYVVYNPSSTAQTVYVYDASGNVVDSFLAAARDTTVITRQPNTNTPPTITTPASATPGTVTGKTTALAISASDDKGEPNLIYTWSLTGTPPAAVAFSDNGRNTAKSATATFAAAGLYHFVVTVTDGNGATAASGVDVTVVQTPTGITVSPATATVAAGATKRFSATATDQFGNAIASPTFGWSVTTGGGSVDSTGLFTAPSTSGSSTITATLGNASGSATVATQAPVQSADLAVNHPVVSSSNQNSSFTAAKAVDGSASSRWSSKASDPQWIYVDLGSVFTITRVRLNWESAAGKDYLIQVSNDATNWTTIKTVAGNMTAGVKDYTNLTGSGRYVRVYGTKRLTQYGYSLYELNVYGTSATPGLTPLARTGWVPTASRTQSGSSTANALDGQLGTRWTTGGAAIVGDYYQIDFGSAITFDRIVMNSGTSTNDYARGYKILISNNGTDWATTSPITTGTGTSAVVDVSFSAVTARYVRVVLTIGSTSYWSLGELNVYL